MLTRSGAFGLVKVVVSLACLVLIWRLFSPANWAELLAKMDIGFAFGAILALLVGQVASGYRHLAVLYGLGRRVPARRVVALASAGTFFNQVLPSGLGGDIIRIFHLQPRCGWRRSAASVLFDRILGVTFILVVVLLLLPFYFQLAIPDTVKVGITLISVGPLLTIAAGPRLAHSRWLRRILPQPLRLGVYGLIVLRRLLRPSVLVRLALPMLSTYLSYVACFGLFGASLGGGVTPFGYLLIVPLIFVAVQFPISFGGWRITGVLRNLYPLIHRTSGRLVSF